MCRATDSSVVPAMIGGSPRQLRKVALRKLDEQLASAPLSATAQFERACLLAELGRGIEARSAYLDVIARAPGHFGALNNLGALLYETGYRSAARVAYTEATVRHPDNPAGHVNLANLLCEAGEWSAARAHYETALWLAPSHAEAHRGLARLLVELGEEEAAERHRRRGFAGKPVTALPYRGDGAAVSVLLLVATTGGNIPLRHHLDDRVFRTWVVFPEFFDRKAALPPHQLVVNAIADADRCPVALDRAEALLAATTAPLINRPDAVRASARTANAQRLAGIPGLVVPTTVSLSRAQLDAPGAAAILASHGLTFPLLVRSPGFHTGRYFARVETPQDLPDALAALPGRELTAIQYLDARGSDGNARKYRVMFIDGRLYPLHLAISRAWKTHYFTADMAQAGAHRAEEARFLTDMPAVLGPSGVAALEQVCRTLDLDYAGIDFGLAADGRVLLFEANAGMVVNPPDPDDKWAYRRAPIRRIQQAVQEMLLERGASAGAGQAIS